MTTKADMHTAEQGYLLGSRPALVDDAAGVFLPPSPFEAFHKLGRLVNNPIDTVLSVWE